MCSFFRCLPLLAVLLPGLLAAGGKPVTEKEFQTVTAGRDAAFVIVDGATGGREVFNAALATTALPPCSTFKIWNTLVGLEEGILNSADEPFYKWDGKERFLPAWNRDLTLREAFQASCVPAFQALARKIGPDRMQAGLDRFGIGDRNASAGIDVFWLPAPGRKTLLITPVQQADLMRLLATGEVPASKQALTVLKDIMEVRKTPAGTLYGKTGSSANEDGVFNMGWFVGYVESGRGGYGFAMVVRGDGLSGKDARAMVEKMLEASGLL